MGVVVEIPETLKMQLLIEVLQKAYDKSPVKGSQPFDQFAVSLLKDGNKEGTPLQAALADANYKHNYKIYKKEIGFNIFDGSSWFGDEFLEQTAKLSAPQFFQARNIVSKYSEAMQTISEDMKNVHTERNAAQNSQEQEACNVEEQKLDKERSTIVTAADAKLAGLFKQSLGNPSKQKAPPLDEKTLKEVDDAKQQFEKGKDAPSHPKQPVKQEAKGWKV